MHRYDRHIGDYLKDTAHLSLLEHGVYSRLMDVYYTREGGIPAADVTRLIGARSKEEKAAVTAVLGEFFLLDDSGLYVQERCERELQKYRGLQDEASAKREGEKERQRRTRERRKELFETLRKHGVVPKYDAPMSELEALMSRVTSGNGHASVTRDVTGDDTANHQPTPIPHPPPGKAFTTDRPFSLPPDGRSVGRSPVGDEIRDKPPEGFGFVTVQAALTAVGVPLQRITRPKDTPTIHGWIEAGCTAEILDAAIAAADGSGKKLSELSAAYLDPIVRRLIFQRAHPNGNGHAGESLMSEIERQAAAAVEYLRTQEATQ